MAPDHWRSLLRGDKESFRDKKRRIGHGRADGGDPYPSGEKKPMDWANQRGNGFNGVFHQAYT